MLQTYEGIASIPVVASVRSMPSLIFAILTGRWLLGDAGDVRWVISSGVWEALNEKRS